MMPCKSVPKRLNYKIPFSKPLYSWRLQSHTLKIKMCSVIINLITKDKFWNKIDLRRHLFPETFCIIYYLEVCGSRSITCRKCSFVSIDLKYRLKAWFTFFFPHGFDIITGSINSSGLRASMKLIEKQDKMK